MAKYTINHTCGHSREVNLLGKNSEREKKIEWMESQECPACWGAKKREEEDQKPITATIRTNGLDTDSDGNILAEIVLSGGTRAKKEEIKALGYIWGEVRGGVMDMLSMNRPEQAWIKRVPLLHLDKNHEVGQKIKAELNSLEAQIKNGLSVLDMEMARKRIAEKNEKDAQIKKIEKPVKPACYPAGRWNGVVYGKEKYGYRIYVDGDEIKISKDDAKSLIDYMEAIKKYSSEIKKIKEA